MRDEIYLLVRWASKRLFDAFLDTYVVGKGRTKLRNWVPGRYTHFAEINITAELEDW